METKDKRTLKEILDDTKDFQKTIDKLDEREKETVKWFAMGLMAAATVQQQEATA